MVTKTRVPAADFCVNPYIGCPHKCVYCYAEFMRRFSGHSERWGDFLDVKRCVKEIKAAKYAGRKVVFSTTTDPYNPFEKKYRVTREALSAFAGSETSVSVLRSLYDDIYRLKCSDYWNALEKDIISYCARRGLKCLSYFYHEKIRK